MDSRMTHWLSASTVQQFRSCLLKVAVPWASPSARPSCAAPGRPARHPPSLLCVARPFLVSMGTSCCVILLQKISYNTKTHRSALLQEKGFFHVFSCPQVPEPNQKQVWHCQLQVGSAGGRDRARALPGSESSWQVWVRSVQMAALLLKVKPTISTTDAGKEPMKIQRCFQREMAGLSLGRTAGAGAHNWCVLPSSATAAAAGAMRTVLSTQCWHLQEITLVEEQPS